MGLIVKDNMGKFKGVKTQVLDSALGRMAIDITQLAKAFVPRKSGELEDEIKPEKVDTLKHKVVVNSDYASVQEAGQRKTGPGAPTKMFENYTTPGTGKDFLKKAGNRVANDSLNYLKQAANNIRLGLT